MYSLKPLTEETLQQISKGWRVGMEENGCIAVFEIVSRLGHKLKGDEKWVLYPRDSGKEEGPVTTRCFADLEISRLVYCHSRTNGQRYIAERLIDLYE